MTRRSVAAQLTALETRKRAGVRNFVVGMSDPPTAEELEALALAEAEGLPFMIMPPVCATVEEWLAQVKVDGLTA